MVHFAHHSMGVKWIRLSRRAGYDRDVPESHPIPVLSGASEQRWALVNSRRGRDWVLAITSPDGAVAGVTEKLLTLARYRG